MPYRVDLTERATLDLIEIYETVGAEYLVKAHAWFERLERLVFSLDEYPARGKVTPETSTLRHVFHGRKPHIYRVIYQVDEQGQVVTVLHIRHGRRDAFTPDDESSER